MGVFNKYYLHLILTTRNGAPLISENWRSQLYQHLEARLTFKGHLPLAVNGTDNHVHLFMNASTEYSVQEIIKDLKMQSLQFAFSLTTRQQRLRWHQGFAAMTYSYSQVKSVVKFIRDQEEYHINKSHKDEVEDMLDMFEVGYEDFELEEWLFWNSAPSKSSWIDRSSVSKSK